MTRAGTTKWEWQHLWAAIELVYRKAALGTRLAPLRERLKCMRVAPTR